MPKNDSRESCSWRIPVDVTFALIMAGVAAAIAGLYVLVIQSRKATYRKLAQALMADYVSQGAFKTGKITGTAQGRPSPLSPSPPAA